MKYGIREICDVVFRAKANHKIGNKQFFTDEPVVIFDTLKTSTLEGAVTTVYAQGGKGNSRLMGWDGEKTVTFTMEDALISKESLAILTGAGVVEAATDKEIIQHIIFNATTDDTKGTITNLPSDLKLANVVEQTNIYVMVTDKQGNPISEPFIYKVEGDTLVVSDDNWLNPIAAGDYTGTGLSADMDVLVDLYVKKTTGTQFQIGPEVISNNYYIEGATLFRGQDGKDYPAEFIIPNGKVQNNFTFTMASTGDPTTFTFTVDAFPDFLKYYPDGEKVKVFSAIQVLHDGDSATATVDKFRETTTI